MAERPNSYASTAFGTALNTPLPNDSTSFLDIHQQSPIYHTEASPRNSGSFPQNEYPLLPPNAPFHPNDSEQPRASYFNEGTASNRNSYSNSVATGLNSTPLIPAEAKNESSYANQIEASPYSKKKGRPFWFWIVGVVGLVAIVAAVIVPVYFTVIKPKNNKAESKSNTSSGPSTGDSGNSEPGSTAPGNEAKGAITGGDGSVITADDGSTFIYNNTFGGFWISDPKDPFNNNARPNSWTPPLNQSWTWGVDQVFGVNLGGWFVLEPFISPAVFQKYPGAVDEWSLSTLMAADTANGGLNQLEDHYNTFMTEEDFAQIAAAGLNWVRIPIPYWAIEVWPGEPFLERTSWKYILRAIEWARKYGLRVNLDLHTSPGSQNGYNHSGRLGQVNFLVGPMGYANAQRTLNYIRILTEFFSQPEYLNVVPMFGILNEPPVMKIGRDALTSFYLEAHTMIRQITGVGEGKGPYISIHDGFDAVSKWAGFLTGADRIALDTHPYFAFDGSGKNTPINIGSGLTAGGEWPTDACNRWAQSVGQSRIGFGVTVAGEFSNGWNDCGFYLKGIPGGHDFQGDCSVWEDSTGWDDATKAGLKMFAMASMDSLTDWFFWTWKIGQNAAGVVGSPLWSYQLGLQNGWMPTDPRQTVGTCKALGVGAAPFSGTFQPWQTGGVGAGTIAATSTVAFPWPPPSFTNEPNVAVLPTYTATGTVVTMPPPTFTSAPDVTPGNGWFNPSDTALAPTPVAGCTYPDAWNSQDAAVPPQCVV